MVFSYRFALAFILSSFKFNSCDSLNKMIKRLSFFPSHFCVVLDGHVLMEL